MPLSLLDIAPPEIGAKEVTVRGQNISLRGVKASEWATLYARFPELRGVASGEDDGGAPSKMQMVRAQCALIAAGMGHAGEPKHERAALTNLSADEQVQLVTEIVALSMPGDVLGPLFDEGEAGPAPDTEAPATK